MSNLSAFDLFSSEPPDAAQIYGVYRIATIQDLHAHSDSFPVAQPLAPDAVFCSKASCAGDWQETASELAAPELKDESRRHSALASIYAGARGVLSTISE